MAVLPSGQGRGTATMRASWMLQLPAASLCPLLGTREPSAGGKDGEVGGRSKVPSRYQRLQVGCQPALGSSCLPVCCQDAVALVEPPRPSHPQI